MSQSREIRTWIVRAIYFVAFQLILVTVLLLPRNTPPVSAAGLLVNHLLGDDVGNCQAFPGCRTIGYAISQASNGDSITITVHSSPDVFTENLNFSKSLTLVGNVSDPSLIVIDGNGSVTNQRVITITSASTVSISGVTIRNGRKTSSTGAGILNSGRLILDSVVITGNQVIGTIMNHWGGGIDNTGSLTITNSTIGNNQAYFAGGIHNGGSLYISNTQVVSNQATSTGGFDNGGSAQLMNSTVDSNFASVNTGGISNGSNLSVSNSTISNNSAPGFGGISNAGTLTLTNVTVSGNRATSSYGGGLRNEGTVKLNNVTFNLNSAFTSGGGLVNYSGAMTIQNSIIANSVNGNCYAYAPITSNGYNLLSDTSCSTDFNHLGDLTNTNPRLSPLANYGGATKTHGLLVGSPAINAGNFAISDGLGIHCMPTDQRGVTRPQFGRCDIGAFEGFLYPLYLPLIMR